MLTAQRLTCLNVGNKGLIFNMESSNEENTQAIQEIRLSRNESNLVQHSRLLYVTSDNTLGSVDQDIDGYADSLNSSFIDILSSDIMYTIDPIELAEAFHNCHIISSHCFETCLQLSELDLPRQIILHAILSQLCQPSCLVFWRVVIGILYERGYDHLGQRIDHVMRRAGVMQQVATLPTNRDTTHRAYYTGLRHVVEQGSLVNPRDQFALLASRRKQLLFQANSENTCKISQRVLADKYAATLIIGLDIPPADEDMEIFLRAPDKNMTRITNALELEKIAPLTTNPLLTTLVLYSRLILVYAFAGNSQMSENMLTKARQLSCMTGACPELAEMYYFHVYYLLQMFEQNPTAHIRYKIETNVLAGLDILRTIDTDSKTVYFWQQFLLMKLISCLVGIGNHCNVIHNCVVTKECIAKARKYFTFMDDIWLHVETRRRMLYYLAKGRLEEICQNLTLAAHYIRKSIRYARKGHFVEVVIMEKYLNELTFVDRSLLSTQCSASAYVSELENEENQDMVYSFVEDDENLFIGLQYIPEAECKSDSVKTFQLFGDGDVANETNESKNNTNGTAEAESQSVNMVKWTDFEIFDHISDISVRTCELFGDGNCLDFQDAMVSPLLQIERGEPDGDSHPDSCL